MKSSYGKYIVFFLMLFCISCSSMTVNAGTLVEKNKDAQITIEYQVPYSEFSLYKVADVTDTYTFIVTEPFADYEIDFHTLNTDEWKDMVETLAVYVKRDKLEPLVSGMTDQNGKLIFDDISVGVYLVIGKQAQDESCIYRCKPFLAFVPLETERGEWDYAPVFSPKSSEDPIELIDLTVLKIWKDEGMEELRPAEIIVQILKDGEVYEEVVLNEDNSWKHTWNDLSSEFVWEIVEKEVPEGYTVQITQEGTIYQIVNSTEGTPEIPEKLPQTGQNWWPIPILTVAGLLLFMLGWVQRRTQNEN